MRSRDAQGGTVVGPGDRGRGGGTRVDGPRAGAAGGDAVSDPVRHAGTGAAGLHHRRRRLRQPPRHARFGGARRRSLDSLHRRDAEEPDRRGGLRRDGAAGRDGDRRARAERALERHQGRVQHGGRRHRPALPVQGLALAALRGQRARPPTDTPVITRVPNQPAAYNNVSPTYGTDDRILFTSDRPRGGEAHLYPQLRRVRGGAGRHRDLEPRSRDGRPVPAPALALGLVLAAGGQLRPRGLHPLGPPAARPAGRRRLASEHVPRHLRHLQLRRRIGRARRG